MRCVKACAKPFCGFTRICGSVLCVHRSGSFHTRRCRNDTRVASARLVVPTRTRTLGEKQRDAGQDYLESDSEASGIVYGTVQLEQQIAGLALTVDLAPHRRNRPQCAGCGQAGRCTTGWYRVASTSSLSEACGCSFST
jgi:hypothetical protein